MLCDDISAYVVDQESYVADIKIEYVEEVRIVCVAIRLKKKENNFKV